MKACRRWAESCKLCADRSPEASLNWLKYLALLAALGALVYTFPILWEIGLVGAIGGAIWIFAWPKDDGNGAPPAGEQ